MKNLVNIIQELIGRIPREIKVSSINGIRVYTCNTLYTTLCKIVTDSVGNKYTIIAFSQNEYLDLEPLDNAPAFDDTVVILAEITYLHGTPISTNNEYLLIESRQSKKTPFIWLLESYQETFLGAESSLEVVYDDIRLFFMDGAIEDESNDRQNELYIKPMQSLAQLFLDVINEDFTFKHPENTRLRPRARFGVEVTNKGNTRHIFNDGLSGAEMVINLEMYDVSICHQNC